MTLRPYQLDFCERVNSGWKEFQRQLAVAPTGSGKTIMFAHLAAGELAEGRKTLILAHRDELIEQAIDKIFKSTGIEADKEKAEDVASIRAPIVVASVQTLMRDARLQRWPKDHFGLVVADEAHHSISESWRRVLTHFDARVLGVTATPDRGDKKDLGVFYENVAAEISLLSLIDQGYLSKIVLKTIPLKIDLNGVRSIAGDFAVDEVAHAIEPYLGQIAREIAKHASFRRVLAFLPLIATSMKFVGHCREAGLLAEHIDGNSPDRAEKLAKFDRGEFGLLSNAMLLTEGYDSPEIDCVVVLRPTRSRPLFAQMVGRGTRVHELKENLLLLDFLWLHEKHSITRPAHLIAESEEMAEEMTHIADEETSANGDELDIQEVSRSAQESRERKLREELESHSKKKSKLISAEEWALGHHALEIADYKPVMPWESEPITEKQAKAVRRAGVDMESVKDRGHASKILSVYFSEESKRPATDAQKHLMRRWGCKNWTNATSEDARKFFATLRT